MSDDELEPLLSDDLRERRRQLKAQYAVLFAELTRILFEHDPVGINLESNTDEYEPEVGTILPRLFLASGEEDVARIVHEEFVHWFGVASAGSSTLLYGKIARDVWAAFRRHKLD